MKFVDPRSLPNLPPHVAEQLRMRDEIMDSIRARCAEEIVRLKERYGFEDPHPALTALRARPPNQEALVAMTREYNEFKDMLIKAYGRVLDALPPAPVVFILDDEPSPEET